ncbi:MAG: Rpn family recombination-promoting nuclease/putative transposase [Syntrophomonadaceae bacterium]|nr:Rpn family recombination-promoting nuclease/putative transposase [Syntrophomonadaceae bacterium]
MQGRLGNLISRPDIRAVTAAREQINIEAQLANQYNMEKRTLLYWSRMYTGQLQSEYDYRELYLQYAGEQDSGMIFGDMKDVMIASR